MTIVKKEEYFEEISNSSSFANKEGIKNNLSLGRQYMFFYELLKVFSIRVRSSIVKN